MNGVHSSAIDQLASVHGESAGIGWVSQVPAPAPVRMCERCKTAVADRFDQARQAWLCPSCSAPAVADALRGQVVMMRAEDAAGPVQALIDQIAALVDAVNSLRDLVDTRLTVAEETLRSLETMVTGTVARADSVLERFGRGPVGMLKTTMRRAG